MLAAPGPLLPSRSPKAWGSRPHGALLLVWTRRKQPSLRKTAQGGNFQCALRCQLNDKQQTLTTATSTRLDLTFQKNTCKRIKRTHDTLRSQQSYNRSWDTAAPATHHQGQATDPREADGTGGPEEAGTVTPGIRKNQLNMYVHILWEDSQMKVPKGGEIIFLKKRKPASPH